MRLKRSTRWQLLGGAILCALALLYSKDEVSMAGAEASRFAVVESLSEQGVFYIENTHFRTVDRVIRERHVYSDKPPLLSTVAALPVAAAHRITGIKFADNYYLEIYLVNLFAAGGVNVLLFLWLFNALRRIRRGKPELKFLLALSCTVGSWCFAYSVILNNHTPAALAALGLLTMLEKFQRRPSLPLAFGCGVTAGVVGGFDIPSGGLFGLAAVAGCALAAPLDSRRRSALCCIAGGGVILALLALLNLIAYGTIVPLYVAGSTGTYTPGFQHETLCGYIVDTLFWTRGLFSYQPFVLLALPGLWFMRRSLTVGGRVMAAAALAVTLFYLVFTNEYGGFAYGFRYLIVILPILWYYAGAWVLSWRSSPGKAAAVTVLILWGVVAGVVGSYAPYGLQFEAYRTPPGHVTRTISSSFMGNLLTWSYESSPDGPLTRALVRHYGAETVSYYLKANYFMLKKVEPLRRLAAEGLPQNR